MNNRIRLRLYFNSITKATINKGVKLEMYIFYLFSCTERTRVGNYFVLTFQSTININIHSSNAIHHLGDKIS